MGSCRGAKPTPNLTANTGTRLLCTLAGLKERSVFVQAGSCGFWQKAVFTLGGRVAEQGRSSRLAR